MALVHRGVEAAHVRLVAFEDSFANRDLALTLVLGELLASSHDELNALPLQLCGKLIEFGLNFGGSALKDDHMVGILHQFERLAEGWVSQHHVFKDVLIVHVFAISRRVLTRVAAFIHALFKL